MEQAPFRTPAHRSPSFPSDRVSRRLNRRFGYLPDRKPCPSSDLLAFESEESVEVKGPLCFSSKISGSVLSVWTNGSELAISRTGSACEQAHSSVRPRTIRYKIGFLMQNSSSCTLFTSITRFGLGKCNLCSKPYVSAGRFIDAPVENFKKTPFVHLGIQPLSRPVSVAADFVVDGVASQYALQVQMVDELPLCRSAGRTQRPCKADDHKRVKLGKGKSADNSSP